MQGQAVVQHVRRTASVRPVPAGRSSRSEDLLNQAHLALGGRPEGPQVPCFHSVCRQRCGCARHGEGGVVVVAGRVRTQQQEASQGLEHPGIQMGGSDELGLGEAQ